MISRKSGNGYTAVPKGNPQEQKTGYRPSYWEDIPHERFPTRVRHLEPRRIELYLSLQGISKKTADSLRREVVASIRRGNTTYEIGLRLCLRECEIRQIARENHLYQQLYENDCRHESAGL